MKALLQSFCRQRPFRGKTVIPTVRRAGVWRRRSKIYVSATLESVDGILFKEDDVIIVDGNDDEAAEMALRAALARSRSGLPHPGIDYKAPNFYKRAGVSGHAAFVKGAKHVLVELHDAVITLIPLRNEGARLGFYNIDVDNISHNINAPRLGQAIFAALDLSE